MSTSVSIFESQSFCILINLCLVFIVKPIMSVPMQPGIVSRLTSFSTPFQRGIETSGQQSFPVKVGSGPQIFPKSLSSSTGQPSFLHFHLRRSFQNEIIEEDTISNTKLVLSHMSNIRTPGKPWSLEEHHKVGAIKESEF